MAVIAPVSAPMKNAADFTHSVDGDREVVRFTGELTLARIGDLPDRLKALDGKPLRLDVSDVTRVDTVGAWLIHRVGRDRDTELVGASEHMSSLLDKVAQADQPVKIRPDRTPPLYRVLGQMGDATALAGRTMLGLLGFFGSVMISFGNVIMHPRRFRLNAVTQQFEVVGVH
ncbi:MAG TPA: STAS domain-containing protein, partial [Allosphingosinicella sp.]|nr:STAS domain-containing protein [Allosphingosinicella sp.]